MRGREALGWGLVGALSFLVLVQGSELVGAVWIGFAVKGVVALAVAGTTTVLAQVVYRRLPGNGRP